MKYLFKNGNIKIRKMKDNITDYSLMAKWLSTNEVLDYYEGRSNPYDLDKIIKKFAPRVKGKEAIEPCIIEYEQKDIGYIQYYRIEPDNAGYGISMKNYRMPCGIDLFIGETNYWNKGIGTILISSMITYLFKEEKADVIFIDPQTWNKRAIRCYEKSGFTPMLIMKNRELHDGEYKDNLIMSITSGGGIVYSDKGECSLNILIAKENIVPQWNELAKEVESVFQGKMADDSGFHDFMINKIEQEEAFIICDETDNSLIEH